MDALDIVSLLEFVIFLILGLLAFARMFVRLGLFLANDDKIPLLLKRDLALFGPLFIVMALILFFRVEGISLQRNPYWVLSSGAAVIAGLAYWVWIEYFRIEQPK